jgi:hypothetical protein
VVERVTALWPLRFGDSCEDVGVNLVRDFRDEREIVPPETVGVAKLLVAPEVRAAERHVVKALVGGLVLLDRRFDATESKGLTGAEALEDLAFRVAGAVFVFMAFLSL